MSLDNEQLEADLTEALTHSKMLERECEQMEYEIECLRSDLKNCLDFNIWLANVYPNAEREYNAVKDVERSV